jgi:hypothetical protein
MDHAHPVQPYSRWMEGHYAFTAEAQGAIQDHFLKSTNPNRSFDTRKKHHHRMPRALRIQISKPTHPPFAVDESVSTLSLICDQ